MNADKEAGLPDWAHQQVRAIGQAVKSLRGKHSAQWLSDRTNELGHLIPRTTIADIENGRRKYVSTAELSVLAWALAVPPVRLLYPALPDGDTEIIPGESASADYAMTWFSGETEFVPKRLIEGDPTAPVDDQWHADAARAVALFEGGQLVKLSRRRLDLRSRIKTFSETIASIEKRMPGTTSPLATELINLQSQLEHTDKELRALPDAVLIDEPDGNDTQQPEKPM